jgi:excisionase family DNA binding protein
MVMTVMRSGPMIADEDERPGLAEAEALVRERSGKVFLTDEDGKRVELPETAVRLMYQLVHGLARGNPVEVNSLPKEFTVQWAAEVLDLRPEDIVRLLDEGEIPAVHVGEFRRIRFQDLMAYMPTRDADRRAAMDEIIRLSEEMGLYEHEASAAQAEIVSRHGRTSRRGGSSAAS